MPEGAVRLASLTVIGGPLKGRKHDPDEVVTEVLIGADQSCHLTVDLPSVSPIHARLWCDLNEVTVYDTRAPTGLYLNDDRVAPEAKVKNGDILWLGAPGDEESVGILCHFEPWVEVLPGAPMAADEGDEAAPPGAPARDEGPGFVADASEASPPARSASPEAEVQAPSQALPRPAASVPPPEPPQAAPTQTGEEDPFFVGDAETPTAAPPPSEPGPAPVADDEWAIADPSAPAQPPPEAPAAPPEPEAPPVESPAPEPASPAPVPDGTDDPFFIAEDALTVGPDAPAGPPPAPPPMAPPQATPPPPAPLAPAPAAPEVEEVVDAEEIGEAPEVVHADPVPEAPASPAPGPDSSDRAPLPPRRPGDSPPPPPAAGDGAEPAPPPRPAARRPVARPGQPAKGARRPRPSVRPARRAASGGSANWVRPLGLGALAAVVLAAIGGGFWMWLGSAPAVDAITPQRVRVGQRAILSGSGFSDAAAENTVLFGSSSATVLSGSATRLEVEVPDAVVKAGAERRVPVVVRRGDRESEPVEVAVFAGPRLHGLSPDVAMPGEEVLLAGAGWGVGATVRFGDLAASVLAVEPTAIRVLVPALPTTVGTPAPVVVTVGGVDSNPAPFFVGRLPLVTGVAPTSASMGDTLTVSGRGFRREAELNDVTIDGVAALVASAFDDELQVVVPRLPTGEATRALELRVPGSEEMGRALLQVTPVPDPIPLRFVAEPFPGPPERPHAVVSTGLGPAFVLSAANGRSAGQRAHAAQEALNAAAAAFATSPGLLPEARDMAARPVVGLPGRPEPLLEATSSDAAAYNEDWTGLRGRGGPVTPARLARWWEAVARDLFVMLGQSRRPSFAAALAPEGRALQQVFDSAGGGQGVPLSAVTGARRSVRNGLRLVGLRVPASVTAEPASAQPAGSTASAAAATPEPLDLVGTWSGSETEGGRRRYLTLTFKSSEGTISYEGGITLTVPFLSYDRPGRNRVRFAVQIRGGMRHYHGEWDGETLSGNITRDQAGQDVTGSFEVRKR